MPNIQMKIDSLVSRGNEIQTILQPISRPKYRLAWGTKSNPGLFIIAVHDGAQTTSEYRNWRFSTFVDNFNAMYFELWRRTEEDEKYWYLDRAYLSIYERIQTEEKEFLCLHCDPNESSESEDKIYLPSKKKIKRVEAVKLDKPDRDKYKKGPHLHIKAAKDPLPHAHFALNLGHLDTVLRSVESLSEAMKSGILMLKEEVLDRF